MRRFDLRNRRFVLVGLAASAVILFLGGMVAAYESRNDRICPDGRAPISERQGILEPTLYLCHGGKVVTK
jgi:hypothetical protein